MKLKFKISICAFLTVAAMELSACAGVIDGPQGMIYDDNKKIASEGKDFSYALHRQNDGKASYELDINYAGFYGIDTIYQINAADGASMNLKFSSQVNKGKFKLVLIDPNKKVQVVEEGSKNGSKKVDLNNGKYYVRIVGKAASGKINVSVEDVKNVSVETKRNNIFDDDDK